MKPCPLCNGEIKPAVLSLGGGCDGSDQMTLSGSYRCQYCFTVFIPYEWQRVSGKENRRFDLTPEQLMDLRYAEKRMSTYEGVEPPTDLLSKMKRMEEALRCCLANCIDPTEGEIALNSIRDVLFGTQSKEDKAVHRDEPREEVDNAGPSLDNGNV